MKHSKSKKKWFYFSRTDCCINNFSNSCRTTNSGINRLYRKSEKDKVIAETRMLHEAVQTVTLNYMQVQRNGKPLVER